MILDVFLGFILGTCTCLLTLEIRRRLDRARPVDPPPAPPPVEEVTPQDPKDLGVAVEVDCKACGKFNRVPSHRLRDRPACGRCKARLMPGKHLVLCRRAPLDDRLRSELRVVWLDFDQLWKCLADHVAIQEKHLAEERGEKPRVVN